MLFLKINEHKQLFFFLQASPSVDSMKTILELYAKSETYITHDDNMYVSG